MTSGRSRVASSIIWRRNARRSGGEGLPWKRFHVRTSIATRVAYEPVRVLLADPPAFTPPYDHELAEALARDGVDVELVTSRFRFGGAPEPDGYRRRELFYPLSSRVFGRSRLRLPLKVAEHPFGLAALNRLRADVLHMQWLPAPELDAYLFRPHMPSVFTAHDLLPRRTAHKTELWLRLFDRFDRIVVHSESGRKSLLELGVDPDRLRVIPHPVFRSEPARQDDGRTVLAFGMIRPYKGLGDAIEAVRRAGDARLVVAGDPLEPIEPYRASANGLEVEWRLGYLPPTEIDRAFGDATVAVFPYRPELDQSGALLRALGAGVPAIAYDVGGIAEPVRRFEAGRVVPAGDVAALAAAIHELLGDSTALARAREGARRAREELTWDAAAQAHLALYEEIA
jgi:glycosyltransferase involved in cell wall biosynthesis